MNHPPVVLLDARRKQIEICAQGAVGSFLILPGESAVTGNIRVQDGGELAWKSICHAVGESNDHPRIGGRLA
jgi:hypothetical protein